MRETSQHLAERLFKEHGKAKSLSILNFKLSMCKPIDKRYFKKAKEIIESTMSTVTYTPDNFLLIENDMDIVVVNKLIATTYKELADEFQIPHLERELFVKPVDYIEARRQYLIESFGEGPDDMTEMVNQAAQDWLAGYNFAMANSKGEFTREDMLEAMKYASSHLSSVKGMRQYLDSIRPLSLPKSIQVTDNNWNNPKIVW